MTEQIFTAHGFDFIADTMDWHDSHDAETASDKLGEIIDTFNTDEAAELHSLLTRAAQGIVEWDHPKLDALQKRCDAILTDVTKDYQSQSFDGHNCTIVAA